MIIVFGIVLAAIIGFIAGYFIRTLFIRNKRPQTPEDALPNCRCKDVNQCETWCYAKAMFAKDNPE